MKKVSTVFACFSITVIMPARAMDSGERTRAYYAKSLVTYQHVQETSRRLAESKSEDDRRAHDDLHAGLDSEHHEITSAASKRILGAAGLLTKDGKQVAPKIRGRMAAAEAERSSEGM